MKLKYVKLLIILILTIFVLIELYEREDNSSANVAMTDLQNASIKNNLMFIKTHKTGSSTLGGLFYLYGIKKKFNFVLFPYTNKLDDIEVKDIDRLLPPRNGERYNIQVQHSLFNPHFAHIVLPKNSTFYLTAVRSPIGHFSSMFVFFGHEDTLRMKYKNIDTHPFDELANIFLKNTCDGIDLDDTKPVEGGCLFLNSDATDLGWSRFTESMDGTTVQQRIDAFIDMLDTELDLVMITDRMDESLVVLKEYMGWEVNDILYLTKKITEKKRSRILSTRTENAILDRMVIDRQIFNHFSAKLDKQIELLGKERIRKLVVNFKLLRQNFEDKCYDKKKGMTQFCDHDCVDPKMRNVVNWQLSEYGKSENPSCSFLNTEYRFYCMAISDVQLSQDYTDMEFEYESSPEVVQLREIIQKI